MKIINIEISGSGSFFKRPRKTGPYYVGIFGDEQYDLLRKKKQFPKIAIFSDGQVSLIDKNGHYKVLNRSIEKQWKLSNEA